MSFEDTGSPHFYFCNFI